jgi:predicted TIM-barrel fold metal-dependent hydrolase
MDEALAQMKTAKENSAVAVCMRPLEGERNVAGPYFYPLYEQAASLDMSIALHIANGNPAYCELYWPSPQDRFAIFRVPTVVSCFTLLMSELPALFPTLRWEFIEASAQWIPWVHSEAAIRYKMAGRKFPEDIFHEYNIFVTCQTNDDLSYILKFAGHCVVIGTDYRHTDPSSEVDTIAVFREQTGISQEAKDRILHYNPKALDNL